MTIALRIPETLHRALPAEVSISGMVRDLLTAAISNNEILAVAFANRAGYRAAQLDIKRYAVYLPKEEQEAAIELADRYLLSLNQLIQILLEDVMYRAGKWPMTNVIDKTTE